MPTETSTTIAPATPGARTPHGSAALASIPAQLRRAGGLLSARPAGSGIPTGDEPPRMRSLVAVCAWAALLGFLGLVLGIRGLLGIMTNSAPGWYEPATVTCGVIGVSLTVAAFLNIREPRLPWALLGGASLTLLTAMVFTAVAF